MVVTPATIMPFSQLPIDSAIRRKVAAYGRVSTDSEEQQTSYEAQVTHYTQFIQNKPEWSFAGMYADEGLSGLQMKKRDEFNRMICDALDGKIDLILVKSVSRFARNTVDTLRIVRELKAAGVEVYFEKENIYTFDPKAELILTIMASLAQEESRSLSENVKWGKRKRMADGKFGLPYKHFLGYEKGPDGKPKIVEAQAQVVRLIYSLFLQSWSINDICRHLMDKGIPSPSGKKTWRVSTVQSILTNEKYKGDANLQKTFTLDYLEKKRKWNEGEVDQYYHTGTHPAIIDPDTFDMTQLEIARRQALGKSYGGKDPFSSRIVCGECGGLYGAKVWHSNTNHRRTIYRCNHKYDKGKPKCSTPHFTEDEIKGAFVTMFNRMLEGKDEVIAACHEAVEQLQRNDALKAERTVLTEQLEELTTRIRAHINTNASTVQDQDEYGAEYEDLAAQYTDLKGRITTIDDSISARRTRCTDLKGYLNALEGTDGLVTEFDERLWNLSVDSVTVQTDGTLVFQFKDGRGMEWR
ncbi:recombinase family protein [Eubacteriales bacterium OttesenSCG-928-N13]|nr:recombinase family protein [Eubacteriales bacterium OttesenSCG-928-N13]